jgi:hypothetical protein
MATAQQGGSRSSFEDFEKAASEQTRRFETYAAAVASTPDGAKVEWKAHVVGVAEPPSHFAPGQAATSDWKVESTITRDAAGRVVSIKNDLQIKVHFNILKIGSREFAQYRKAFFASDGEFAHVSDALKYARQGWDGPNGHFNSAVKIANETSRDLIGQVISPEAAKARMENSLQDWTAQSMHRSHVEWDRPYSVFFHGHSYGFF